MALVNLNESYPFENFIWKRHKEQILKELIEKKATLALLKNINGLGKKTGTCLIKGADETGIICAGYLQDPHYNYKDYLSIKVEKLQEGGKARKRRTRRTRPARRTRRTRY